MHGGEQKHSRKSNCRATIVAHQSISTGRECEILVAGAIIVAARIMSDIYCRRLFSLRHARYSIADAIGMGDGIYGRVSPCEARYWRR